MRRRSSNERNDNDASEASSMLARAVQALEAGQFGDATVAARAGILL